MLCWRCGQQEGSMLHVFWSCPVLQDISKQVSEMIFKLINIKLQNDPAAFPLHLAPLSTKWYKKSIHLLNAAKACIPLVWKQTTAPSISLSFCQINKIQLMEETVAFANGIGEQCRKTSFYWTDFIYSSAFQIFMTNV